MYHLKLTKALSYTGIVKATKKTPDVFVEDKATADAAVATGYFTLVEETAGEADGNAEGNGEEQQTAHLDKAQLEEMTVPQLKELANDMGISTVGFNRKSDYVDAIAAVEVVPGPEEDENEVDYGEGSPTMVELQQ